MEYEGLQELRDRMDAVPNSLLPDPNALRIRYRPDMAALGGEVITVAKGSS